VYFCLRNMLHADYVFENCCMWIISSRALMYLDLGLQETSYILLSSSWNFMHVHFSLRETFILSFPLVKPVSFVELIGCWFLFVKIYWSWYFLRETCCMSTFSYSKLNLSWYFSFWNLQHMGFSPWNTCWFLLVKVVPYGLFL